MHENTVKVLVDVAAYLERAVAQRMVPAQASAGLDTIRPRHPEASIDLVWEDQAFDGSYHFDALIRPASGGTVSVSVCGNDSLPWTLRGLQRWRDSDLLRVNGTVLSVENAIAQLEMLWEQGPLMRRLVDSCIIEAELKRTTVETTPTDVQRALDGLRRGRGLTSATAMRTWMQDSGTTLQQLEELATRLARALKLRERIVGDEAERYFAAHRTDFDTIRLAVVKVPSEALARQILASIDSTQGGLVAAARDAFVNDPAGRTELTFRKDLRYKLAAENTVQLFDVQPGILLGPIPGPAGFTLMQVLSIHPAQMDDITRNAVQTRLFEEWLATQRRGATVEWFWGNTNRTAAAAA
jgi:putative peptide maturation system protein